MVQVELERHVAEQVHDVPVVPILDAPVPHMITLVLLKTLSQDRVRQRLVVLIIMVETVSEDEVQQHLVEQISQVLRVFPQDRDQQRLVELIITVKALFRDRVHQRFVVPILLLPLSLHLGCHCNVRYAACPWPFGWFRHRKWCRLLFWFLFSAAPVVCTESGTVHWKMQARVSLRMVRATGRLKNSWASFTVLDA